MSTGKNKHVIYMIKDYDRVCSIGDHMYDYWNPGIKLKGKPCNVNKKVTTTKQITWVWQSISVHTFRQYPNQWWWILKALINRYRINCVERGADA